MDRPIPAGGRRQGGGERGKLGPRDDIPSHTANRPPVSIQRLPEILDGRYPPPGGSRLESSSWEQTQADGTRPVRAETEAGATEERGHAASGESAPVKPLAARATQAREGTKRRRNRIHAFVEDPKTGTARNAGPAPYRAAGSLSSVDGESTDTREQGQTQCGRNMVRATHTQRYLSAAPRPPRSRTELVNLNKRSPPPACVRAEIRHRRDGKQKPNKQREPLQKGPVQRIKIPVG